MQFTRSLKENHIFRRLYSKGTSMSNSCVVVYCRRNRLEENRLGLTVSKKLGHAVVRNLLRRRFRAIYRLHEQGFARGYDIVIVARTHAVDAPYTELEQAFLNACAKAGIYNEAAQTE